MHPLISFKCVTHRLSVHSGHTPITSPDDASLSAQLREGVAEKGGSKLKISLSNFVRLCLKIKRGMRARDTA